MPLTCVAYNCTNRHQKGSGISFHRFPSNQVLRQKWVDAVNRANWTPTSSSYLCSHHFQDTCFRRINDRNYLLDNSLPDRFDFTDRYAKTKHPKQLATTTTRPTQKLKVTLPPPPKEPPPSLTPASEDLPVTEVPAVTEVLAGDHAYIFPPQQQMKKRVDESNDTMDRLRKQLKMSQQKVRREKEKCARLRRLLGEAQRKVAGPCVEGHQMQEEGLSEVMRDLCGRRGNTKSGVQYTQAVKDFALTLSGYSVKAYEFLRKHVNLPHYHTLRRWTSPEGQDGHQKLPEGDVEGIETVDEFDVVTEEV